MSPDASGKGVFMKGFGVTTVMRDMAKPFCAVGDSELSFAIHFTKSAFVSSTE